MIYYLTFQLDGKFFDDRSYLVISTYPELGSVFAIRQAFDHCVKGTGKENSGGTSGLKEESPTTARYIQQHCQEQVEIRTVYSRENLDLGAGEGRGGDVAFPSWGVGEAWSL